MNMDRDVSTLMMGTFSGVGTDQFGRERDKRHSLLLDTVMEGRARASHSRLLQMPAEVLADIADLLSDDKSTLASLALVNSDCRQLARCCQFAEVHFDYSHQAQQFVVELARGALTEAQQPTIAACIRRVVFASRPQYVAQHHRELYQSIWGEAAQSFTREQRETFQKESAEYYVQLRKASILYIHEYDDALEGTAHLDRYIIPALRSQNFSSLRSLSLAWGGGSMDESTKPHDVHVPEAALITIGLLVSLEQLSLCAGIRIGWRHQWLVDHDQLRRHIGQLKRLKKLALVRDTYPIPLPGIDSEQYYDLRFGGSQESIDAKARPELDMNENTYPDAQPEGEEHYEHDNYKVQVWERAHRNRMLVQAEKYAAVLLKLEWVFCGQRPMGFEPVLERSTAPRRAVPLTKTRDECYTFLQSTFRGSCCDS
ncbi:hypothetical protein BHE90_016540 [Fusarium euwallaceae]|uniref:F-box domain-containing protein n=1 Tax=Fusarium euwallaceae TaxID=1147111 RepID=A0A430L043_9HYPO|nr:hypothetical protein BHE90_016540 [Fusarium euwallaceae]